MEGIRIPIEVTLNQLNTGLNNAAVNVQKFATSTRPASIVSLKVNSNLFSSQLKQSGRELVNTMNVSSANALTNVNNNTLVGLKKTRSIIQGFSSTSKLNISVNNTLLANEVKTTGRILQQTINTSSTIASANLHKKIKTTVQSVSSIFQQASKSGAFDIPIGKITNVGENLNALKNAGKVFAQNLNISSSVGITNFQKNIDVGIRGIKESFFSKNPQMAQSAKSFDFFGKRLSSSLMGATKTIESQSIKIKSAMSLVSKSADVSFAKAIQPSLDKIVNGSQILKQMRQAFSPDLYRAEFFGNTVPSMASVWAENINKAVTPKIMSVQNAIKSLGMQSSQLSKQMPRSFANRYNQTVTGQVINSAMGKAGNNLGINIVEQSAIVSKAIKTNYGTALDYVLGKFAIVAKASKDKQYTAGMQMYKSVLVDVGTVLSKGFKNQGLKSTATYAVSATQGFLGLKQSMLGMLTTAVLIGQVLSRNFWVNLLTPIGDIQQYLVAGLIPNIATITQMVGIINRYSAGPLLTQARYASVVRWLGIGEKVLASMTNKAGELYSSFKGVGLASKLLTVPAKMSLALMDMVNTLRLFNTQLQAAILGASTLGSSIVDSAESLLSGGGFLMPGMMPMGPTATTMFQIDQGIESAVNFDQLTQVFGYATAAAGATREEIDKVRMSILEAGDSSTLTLQQIADGMTELAVGGNDIGEIKKTFDSLSKVSLTTGVEIPQIADPLERLASAYEVEDFESMSFAIGKIAISTGTSVIDIANSLTSLQPVAKDTNAVFEDMAILITSLMSDTGRTASQVTAGIRSVYSEIEKASSGDKEKQKVLSKLGISLEEVQIAPGYLRPIDEVIQTIRSKVSKASKEGKDSYGLIYNLLGGDLESKQITSQVLGAGKISDSFVETTRGIISNLSSAKSDIENAVSEQADTFTGKLQRLTNATFAVSVSVGRMFQPFFEMWIDGALSIASWFNHLSDGLQRFGISLQALLPIAILYFKAWTLHGRVVTGLTTTYTLLISLLKEEGRVKFLKDISKDFSAIKDKMKELGQTTLDILSGKGSLKQAGADLLDFIRKIGKANFDDLTSSTMETTRNLLMPVDALGRWAGSLTRVNVSAQAVTDSLVSMGRQMLQLGKEGAEFATWQAVGMAGSIKKRVSGTDAGKERITNAYKMAMGYGADTMPTIDGKNVYEAMNFYQNMALLAVQIGLVTAAWYTLTELFKRSEGAKIAEDTKKLNKELQETYKTTGLISKDKSFTEIGKGLFSSVRDGFGKIQKLYSQIDILRPLENQLGKFEQSLMNTKKKDFTPKMAPIEQTITAKQAGKAVLDLFVGSRKGPTTKPVDPTNLRLGAVTINKASTQDFTNKLNLLIVKSFVIQKSNAIQQWATGVKDELQLGLVRGVKATVGFVNEMKSFVNNLGSEVGKFKDKVVTGLIDGVKTIYEGTVDYIKRIKEVGLVEASREKLSADPKSSFGNDASVSGLDVANGLGMVAGSMTGLLMAASVLGIALNPLGLVIAGLASAFVGLTGILKGAWKTAEQAGNIQSMLAKDELLKTTDLSLESSQNFLNKYGISNKSDLAQAKERLTHEQKAEIEAGAKTQIENLQSAINALEKTKSASPEEKAITETRIKLYQDEVNRLRHREGVIKGTIALNEKLVYSYKELNDEIAKMNYKRELTNSFNNAKYEKQLVEDPDKLINGEKIIAKERAKMRENEIRGSIQALAEEKRKLSERTQYASKNEEEHKEYEAAKKRLLEIDIEYNKQVGDLAKAQQEERIRLNKEAVDSEMEKIKQLQDGAKLKQTKSSISIESQFGQGKIDRSKYEEKKNNLQLSGLVNEKGLLEKELDAYIKLNRGKNFSDKDLAQKRVEIEQKTAEITLQIIEEKNKQALEKELKTIEKIEAEKTRVLLAQSRDKESKENDLARESDLVVAQNSIKNLPIERDQNQLDYQLKVAELAKDDIATQKIREEMFKNQLTIKQNEIEAEKESFKLQSQSKQIALERAKIEADMAVVEAQANLSRAIANKEGQDEINKLKDELQYRQDLVANANKNIANNQLITKIEEERIKLSRENELALINQTRQEEKNRQELEKELKIIEKIAAEKTRVLLAQSRNKESKENDLARESELTTAQNSIKNLPIERDQNQLDYQLKVAELAKDDIATQKIREEMFKNQLTIKQNEIEAEKESFKLQSQSKQIALERVKIEADMAVVEAQANLSRAIANKEGQDEINKLKDELQYKQDLVANANKNIANNKLITKIEEERIKLSRENELALINQTRQEEKNRQELEKELKTIEKIAAEKTRVLLAQSRDKESKENDLARESDLTTAQNSIKNLPIEQNQNQLDYQLKIAELAKDDIASQKIREEMFKNQLAIKQNEIETEKESFKLQTQSKQVALERAKIEAEMAVIEAQANLSRAIANKEGQDEINKLKDELQYKQDLVANANKNIANNKLITKIEEERIKLSRENELVLINQTRQADVLREKMEGITKEVDKQNKANKEDSLKTQISNKEKLLPLIGTGGFDLASGLMEDKEALTDLDNQIKTLQFKLSELRKLNLMPDSQEVLDVEQELNDTVLNKRLTLLNQEIEFKKQLLTESQKQIKLIEDEITLAEAKNALQQATTEQIKASTSAELKLLETQKSILDNASAKYETAGLDTLMAFLKEQAQIQRQIDQAKLKASKEELESTLANLRIEEQRDDLASKKQRIELQNNALLARDAMLQADKSGNPFAIQLAKQQLETANQALSVFEEQESINKKIRDTKKATAIIEGSSLVNQEKANQKAEQFSREQEKINAISRNITNEIDKQQKKMQSVADLNKAISDYRINALEKESSRIDDIIGMRKELGNKDSDMPGTLRKELTLQMESIKKGSSTQSEKSLYAEKLNIEQRLAKERYQALLAEQAMEKAMFDMETRKLGLEMRTAEMQAKIIAMQSRGTELEVSANDLVAQAGQANIDFEKERSIAKKALDTRQAMDRDNLAYDNTSKINETRRVIAEAGYTPEGKPAVFKPSDFIVPTLVVMDESLKQIDKSILKFKEIAPALDVFTNSIEGLAQRIDQIQPQTTTGQSPSTYPSNATTPTQNKTNPNGPDSSGTVINVASVSVISSDPTGDARKVLTDLTKANKNK